MLKSVYQTRLSNRRGGLYFVIEKENVFEIERMPDGEAGSRVTKAVWMRRPTRQDCAGIWIVADAWPVTSIFPV